MSEVVADPAACVFRQNGWGEGKLSSAPGFSQELAQLSLTSCRGRFACLEGPLDGGCGGGKEVVRGDFSLRQNSPRGMFHCPPNVCGRNVDPPGCCRLPAVLVARTPLGGARKRKFTELDDRPGAPNGVVKSQESFDLFPSLSAFVPPIAPTS